MKKASGYLNGPAAVEAYTFSRSSTRSGRSPR